jgi:hypothetical protein
VGVATGAGCASFGFGVGAGVGMTGIGTGGGIGGSSDSGGTMVIWTGGVSTIDMGLSSSKASPIRMAM